MLQRLRRARADLATMRTLLPQAERLAQSEGLARPGAEHLLLAALDLDRTAVAALAEVGVDRHALQQALAEQHAAALRSVGVVADEDALAAALPPAPERAAGAYRSEPSQQALFQASVRRAKAERSPLRSAHVLLATLDLEHGPLPRALDHLGVDRTAVRSAAERALAATDR